MKNFHLYQMTYWESNSRWLVNDVKNLSGASAKWYAPMRVLEIPIEEYVLLLINKFNATIWFYFDETNFLAFYFKKEKDAKAFCSYVNAEAKKKNFYCF